MGKSKSRFNISFTCGTREYLEDPSSHSFYLFIYFWLNNSFYFFSILSLIKYVYRYTIWGHNTDLICLSPHSLTLEPTRIWNFKFFLKTHVGGDREIEGVMKLLFLLWPNFTSIIYLKLSYFKPVIFWDEWKFVFMCLYLILSELVVFGSKSHTIIRYIKFWWIDTIQSM